MKKTNYINLVFLCLMGLAFANTGIQALTDPAAVLAQVGIELNTTSAFSSMRANYGGMHLAFGLFCLFAAFRSQKAGLGLVVLYTLGFVGGRLVSILNDGAPNEFVSTWLITESVSMLIAGFLLYRLQLSQQTASLQQAALAV